MDLHFCQWTRAAAIQANQTYAEVFLDRLLPSFDRISEEAKEAAQNAWSEFMSRPANDHEYIDSSDFADTAMERGVEVYENLNFVKQQLLGLSIAGLYHLWERTLKQFLIKELGRFIRDDSFMKELMRADFKSLVKLLNQLGFDIGNLGLLKPLDELRLVANTVKHGNGDSCNDLAALAPNLFDMGLINYKGTPDYDDLKFTGGDFMRYSNIVKNFWTLFPEWMELPK